MPYPFSTYDGLELIKLLTEPQPIYNDHGEQIGLSEPQLKLAPEDLMDLLDRLGRK